MKDAELYTIGKASSISGVPVKTLRYYDGIGLVVPKERDSENNYRYYSKSQLIILIIIRRLRGMGCDLKSIKEIVAAKNNITALRDYVRARMNGISEEISKLESIRESNVEFLNRLDLAASLRRDNAETTFEAYLMKDAHIEEIPEISIFSDRRIMPDYCVTETSVDRWSQLIEKCREEGLTVTGPQIAVFHTGLLEQFIMKDCDLEIGMQVREKAGCKNIRKFGGFTAAVAIHIGDYANMINTYIILLQWINKNGYEASGEAAEEYIISPVEVCNKNDNIAKIIIPVKQREPEKTRF